MHLPPKVPKAKTHRPKPTQTARRPSGDAGGRGRALGGLEVAAEQLVKSFGDTAIGGEAPAESCRWGKGGRFEGREAIRRKWEWGRICCFFFLSGGEM